tara:strand:- start:98 stop:298 length:201 start_codon:yes stop_codon:yes gene_type:complete
MTEVPIHPNGFPCKCSGKCNHFKAYEDTGKPKYIDFDKFIGKDFFSKNEVDFLINNYLKTEYCLNK